MSSRNILMINRGSSSIKFALVNEAHSLFPLHGLAERLGSHDTVLHWKHGGDGNSLMIFNTDHRATLTQLLPMVQNAAGDKLHGIDHWVVYGGELSIHATHIDNRVVEAIRATTPLAPLHNPVNLQGIEAAMTLLPRLPHVTVFDTTFYQSLPEHAYRYALPETLYREHDVHHYGFHGTSHRYVSHRAAEMTRLTVGDSSWLSARLGNGNSTCAIVNDQSLSTSMGLTPLGGLVIGTRSGDIDPNLHSHLARTLGWSLERTDSMLNNENGLLGLPDLSNNMHILKQKRGQDRPGATLAIEVFYYHLAKSLAAMSCTLSQLDGMIFTDDVSENSSLMHARTAAHLRLFDLHFGQGANARHMRSVTGPIQAAGHPRVLMVPTDEERQITLDTLALLD